MIYEIQEGYYGPIAVSQDIVTTMTLDLRSGTKNDQRVNITTSTPIRNRGAAALSDQVDDAASDVRDFFSGLSDNSGDKQPFGFIYTGGSVESDWGYGLSDAEQKEVLNIANIIGAAGAFKDIGDFNKLKGKMDNLFKFVKPTKDQQAIKDAVSILTEQIIFVTEAIERVENLENDVDAILGGDDKEIKTLESDSTICDYCPETIDKETLRGSGDADFKHPPQKRK